MIIPHESPESSSPIITRAVAAGLQGRSIDNYNFPAWQKLVLRILGGFPQPVARTIISHFQTYSGLPYECLVHFSIDDLIQARLNDYSNISGRYPAVVLGAGMGGATTYLSLALNAPFLPQAFVITLKNGSVTGNPEEYLARSLKPSTQIARSDSRLMTIQHFDPVHDGWLTRYVNHIRFKLIDVPETYKNFIRKRIEHGGSVIFLDGAAQWLRYRIGERSVFQVGGWGDVSAQEYLDGSPRLDEYSHRIGLTNSKWSLPDKMFPLETGPESEWGSEPGLAESLQVFCEKEGYQFVRLHFPDPNDVSRLAFIAAQKLIEKDNRIAAGTLIECFSQFDSTSAMQSGLLPLWLIFNTADSVRYLQKMSPDFPKDKPVFFSPLSTFSITPDMAHWTDWQKAIGRNFINIGTRASHYPSDARSLVGWFTPLRKWVEKNYEPLKSRLTAGELFELNQGIITKN